jgi:NADH dehydrogenase
MRVFVTGASGGLGRAFLENMLRDGHIVTALSRREMSTQISGLEWIRGDLSSPGSWASALAGADAVAHLAALTHAADPAAYYPVNVEGTRLLIEVARHANFSGRFLFVGTRAMGEACGAYGASKELAEAVVRASGLDFVIVRPAEVMGLGRGEAAAQVVWAVDRLPIVPIPGMGYCRLAPVHVEDVTAAMSAALVSPLASRRSYVLAGPKEMTYSEMVETVMLLRGVKKPKLPVPFFLLRGLALAYRLCGLSRPPLVADQIPRLTCPKSVDIDPARRDLGFAPRPFEAMLD